MPASTCPKCGFNSFELTFLTSGDPNTNVRAVQCESCGTIVGVMDDLESILSSLEKRLKAVEKKLGK
jgi:uncharacterized Zn finger protein